MTGSMPFASWWPFRSIHQFRGCSKCYLALYPYTYITFSITLYPCKKIIRTQGLPRGGSSKACCRTLGCIFSIDPRTFRRTRNHLGIYFYPNILFTSAGVLATPDLPVHIWIDMLSSRLSIHDCLKASDTLCATREASSSLHH